MDAARFEHFDHGADIGVRGVGGTPAEAFEQAALALTAVITPPEGVVPLLPVAIACEAPDLGYLLYGWLNEIVYEMAVRNMLFGRFEVVLDGGRLRATAWGEPVDVARHRPAVEVKGATLTALSARQEAGRWVAECVVDV